MSLAAGTGRQGLRRCVLNLLAAAAILGTFAMVRLAMHHMSGGAADSPAPWAEALQRLDDALARDDLDAAERAGHAAHVAALASRRWEGRAAVGQAYLRIGEAAGAPQTAAARARTNYMAALFLARQQASLDGVLGVAGAFAALGDREVAERCLQIADGLAREGRRPQARARVHAARERLLSHVVEAASAP